MFKFPFTNFHELNLDWILSVVKQAKNIMDNGEEDIEHAVETAETALQVAQEAAQGQIPDGTITAAKLAANSVNNQKILDYSITQNKLATGVLIRENLLDNYYFPCPNTSQAGFLPVNQRGIYRSTDPGYFIDRWKRTTPAGSTIIIDENGLYSEGSDVYVRQGGEKRSQLIGKVLTCSILYKNAGLKTVTHLFEENGRFSTSPNKTLVYTTLPETPVIQDEILGIYAPTDDYIIAVKLELGDYQTLARYTGTEWVLNEIPNYYEQLLKCLHYYFKTIPSVTVIGCGFITSASKRIEMVVQVPVPLSKYTVVPQVGSYVLRLGTGGYSALTPNETYVSPESLSVVLPSRFGTAIRIIDLHENASGDPNNSVIMYAMRNVEISAEP